MSDGGAVAIGLGAGLLYLAIIFLLIVSLWRVFEKAGKPGWAGIIPIYNIIVLLEIVNKPIWWVVLMFIPVVNFVVGIMIAHQLSLRFGKGAGFTVGLILLPFIFYPILGFGSAQYTEPIQGQVSGAV